MFSKKLFGLEKNGKFKVWSIEAYFNPEEPDLGAAITINHGKEGGKQTTKHEIIEEGKQGRSPYEQAVSQAESRIKKQIDKGYRESKEDLEDLPLLAMLAHDYKKQGHRIKFPCYVSVKYDGVRCVASKHVGEVILRSRTGQEFDVPVVANALNNVMSDNDSIDGEIYLHGVELQDILSAVTRDDEKCQKEIDKTLKKVQKESSEENIAEYNDAIRINSIRSNLQFHAFDIPMDGGFNTRFAQLVKHELYNKDSGIYYTNYEWCESEEQLKNYFHPKAVAAGFEGVMLRNIDGVYESGKRSADLQKYKTMISSEFLITDMVADKQGDGVYVCQNDLNQLPFQVVMGSLAERRKALEEKQNLIGKYLTVDFQTRYKGTLLPQFPVGKAVRAGYKLNGEFIPQEY